MMLLLEIEELKRVNERVFVPHCSFGLYTLKVHLLDHLIEDLERFGSIYFTEARPAEHFTVLIKQSYRTTSRRLSTRFQKALQNMSSAVHSS